MLVKPTSDNIILKPQVEETSKTTKSGLILATAATQKPNTGQVMAVGPGRTLQDGRLLPPCVKEGDHVIFSQFAGSEIKVGEEIYLLVKEADILATILE